MKTCGILQVQNAGDARGEICGRMAVASCADCASVSTVQEDPKTRRIDWG